MSTPTPARGLNAGHYRPGLINKILADLQPNVQTFRVTPSAIVTREVIVPDISFWQDDNNTSRKIDFAAMKAAGAQGVIIRGGQGAWVDEDFRDNWRDAKAAGLPRGAYWFYDPRYSAKGQAELFGNLFAADKPELDLWLDAEYPTSWGGAWAGWNHLYDYQERLKTIFPTVQKSIYTGYYWWYENVWRKATTAQLAYFEQYPLALAWYIDDPAFVRIPLPWTQPKFRWWQYTDSGDGNRYGVESSRIDLNNFVQGGTAVYKSTFGLGTEPEPPDNGGPMGTINLTVEATYLNGRDGPGGTVNFPAGSTFSTGFRKDDKLETSESVLDANLITKWYKIVKCTRAGVNVVLPAVVWASDGGTANYLRVDSVVTPKEATLDIAITDPNTGKRYGATGIKLPEIVP